MIGFLIGWIADHFYPHVKRGAELHTRILIDEGRRRGYDIIECEGKIVKDVDLYIVGTCVDNFHAGELLAYISQKPYINMEHDLRAPHMPWYKMFASEALTNVFRSPLHVQIIGRVSGNYKHFLHPNCISTTFKDLKLERKPRNQVLYVGDYSWEKGYKGLVEWLKENPKATIWHYGCYDNQTEILTEDGWKFFRSLNKTEKVATLNPETNELEYQYPIRYIQYYYKGKMFRQKSRLIDIRVTLDHNLWIGEQHGENYNWKFSKAKDCPRHIKYKRSVIWIGKNQRYFVLPPIENPTRKNARIPRRILMDDWLEFFSYWITEGSIQRKPNDYRIKISQSKEKNPEIYEDIHKCIERLGYNYYMNEEYFTISNKQLYQYLKQFGKSKDKYIPRELLSLSFAQLEIIFNSMMKGDGDKNGTRYATTSKRLANNFQEILLKIGFAGKITKVLTKTSPQFHIFISRKMLEPTLNRTNDGRSFEKYSGKVYCVEVPNHIIYIRRKGRPCWCGNSGFPEKHPRMREMGQEVYEKMPQVYNQFQSMIFLPSYPQACCRIMCEAFLCKVENIISNDKSGFMSYQFKKTDYDRIRKLLVNGHKRWWDEVEKVI